MNERDKKTWVADTMLIPMPTAHVSLQMDIVKSSPQCHDWKECRCSNSV